MNTLKALLATLVLSAAAPAMAAQYRPTGPIERKYSADGPWAVTTIATTQACDREGNVCDIWYPTQLGANPLKPSGQPFKHPVIVFADGTADQVPAEKNAYFLRHFASWGFVVIRSRDGDTGAGDTVLDAANYILAQNNDSTSIFYGKIDPTRVGLTGHSQGAGTTVYLFSKNEPTFSTYLPIETPERPACIVANCMPQPGSLIRVHDSSIFFIGGDVDPISPLPVNLGYYTPISGAVDKVVGMITLGSHTEIEGSPDCGPGLVGSCNIGVYPLLGFPTAWFMWKLQGAADGPAAFREGGELSKASPNWTDVLSNIPE